MAVKPASTWASNWSGSAGRATTAYNAGVQAYSGDWAAATTAQQATMQQNWLNSLANGTWAAGVTNTGTQGWKNATEAKAPNYGTGFQAGASKYQQAANKLQPAVSSIVASLPARGDINANLQRSAAFAMALHQQAANGQFRA